MGDASQLARIESVLVDVDQDLRAATPGPAVRELRVRFGALSRVVRGWSHVPPHDPQIAAMLECVLDLRAMVTRACGSAGGASSAAARRTTRPPMRNGPPSARTTRPPPRRDASARTTRPPPRRGSDAPPSSSGSR